MFQNLILEMAQKLDKFKTLIQNKHGTQTDYMTIHNNLMTIKEEMKKQFDEIVSSVYNYHDQVEGADTTILTKKNYQLKDNIHKENDLSSSEEELDNDNKDFMKLKNNNNFNINNNINNQTDRKSVV